MKSYINEKQIRLVGKAWEVREWLRQQRRAAGQDIPISDMMRSAGRLYAVQRERRLSR